MKKLNLVGVLLVGVLFFSLSCKKDNTTVSADTIYVPTAADVTATATLAELQQGRTLYMNNCGMCHSLPAPDSYSATNWKSVMSGMVPKTGMSSADAVLVTKYVTRGKS